jgi:hypothetical protein
MNEKSEPDSDVLKLTQKFVLKFVNFKSGIKRSVDFLKYAISVDLFSRISYILSFNILTQKSECYLFSIAYTLLMIGYYLWTMSLNLRIRIIENDLSFTLNQWLHLNPEDSITIEMDYIEKSAKHFSEKNSIDKKMRFKESAQQSIDRNYPDKRFFQPSKNFNIEIY